jgi:heme-degrading monooxygenase HmoA
MIARIWHCWTTTADADEFESLLKDDIFVAILDRRVEGFENMQLLRRHTDGEVEFVTTMLFSSLDAVREFAGDDYEAAVVPEKVRRLLSRFDARSQHYEVRAERAEFF